MAQPNGDRSLRRARVRRARLMGSRAGQGRDGDSGHYALRLHLPTRRGCYLPLAGLCNFDAEPENWVATVRHPSEGGPAGDIGLDAANVA